MIETLGLRGHFRLQALRVHTPYDQREMERLSHRSNVDPGCMAALEELLEKRGEIVLDTGWSGNMIPTASRNWMGTILIGPAGAAYTPSWFVGLKNTGAVALADTMSSKAWSELTGYTQSTRPPLAVAAWADGATSNGASRAVFTTNASLTVGGMFVANNSGKGNTSGQLGSVSDFVSGAAVIASGLAARGLVIYTF
jgi:hypothetical protein